MNVGHAINMQARSEENEEKFASAHGSSISYEGPGTAAGFDTSSDESKGRLQSDVLKFVVKKQPPFHIYPNQEFELEYTIVRADGVGENIPQRYLKEFEDLKIQADLMQSDDDISKRLLYNSLLAENARLIVLDQRSTDSGVSGTLVCRVESFDGNKRKLNDRRDNKYLVRLSSKKILDPGKSIGSVISRTFSVSPYQIVVSTTNEWENVWYKDEGGRDKCIEIAVCAKDQNDQILYENIQLKLTLCTEENDTATEEPRPVENQDKTLTVRGRNSTRQQIDSDTGRAKIRFRVEKVSANHQGKNFVLKVAAEGAWNVSPGFAPPVTVMSKRHKKNRNASLAGGSDHRNSIGTRSPQAAWPSSHAPLHEMSESSKESPLFFEGLESVKIQQAYSGIIDWVQEVVDGIYPLQWQVVGYAQFPDGSPDYSRPHHNMPNPNSFISRILKIYHDSTVKQLRLIGDAIKQHSTREGRMPPPSPSHDLFDRDPVSYGMYNPMVRNQPNVMFSPNDFPAPQPNYPQHLSSMLSPRGAHSGKSEFTSLPQPFPREIHESGYQIVDPSPHSFPGSLQPHPPTVTLQKSIGSPPIHSPEGRIDHPFKQRPLFTEVVHPSQESAAKRLKLSSPPHPQYFAPNQPAFGPANMQLPGYGITRESEVAYVLAKQHKSKRTEERLGFPAYSIRKELIGFYRELPPAGPGGDAHISFVPITQHPQDFGPAEILEATGILNDAIQNEFEAVHRIQDYGSINRLLDSCLVYHWKADK